MWFRSDFCPCFSLRVSNGRNYIINPLHPLQVVFKLPKRLAVNERNVRKFIHHLLYRRFRDGTEYTSHALRRSILKCLVVFRVNDFSALMLTLGVADFSPPHQSSAVSAQAYLHKTPRIIPHFPPTKNPRRKSAGALHQSTNQHLRLGRAHYHLLTGWNINR